MRGTKMHYVFASTRSGSILAASRRCLRTEQGGVGALGRSMIASASIRANRFRGEVLIDRHALLATALVDLPIRAERREYEQKCRQRAEDCHETRRVGRGCSARKSCDPKRFALESGDAADARRFAGVAGSLWWKSERRADAMPSPNCSNLRKPAIRFGTIVSQALNRLQATSTLAEYVPKPVTG